MATVSVTDLVLNFAVACRALMPALDFAQVPYRDHEQYDNWDRVSEPLFQALVTEPCMYAAVGEMKLSTIRVAKYGTSGTLEGWNAYIALGGAPLSRFIQLSTVESPFDYCIVIEGDTLKKVPLDDAHFVFIFATMDGTHQRLAMIDLDAV